MVLTCSCSNYLGNKQSALYQDRVYGQGKRVFNPTAKKDPQIYRCSICGSERSAGGEAPDKKKKK